MAQVMLCVMTLPGFPRTAHPTLRSAEPFHPTETQDQASFLGRRWGSPHQLWGLLSCREKSPSAALATRP